MANDPRYYDEPPLESGPNYKVLLTYACGVISVLASLIYGFWTSRAEQAAEDTRATNQLQWERLQQHGEKIRDHTSEIQQLRREEDDHEVRLRNIEQWRYGRRESQ